MFVLEFLLIVLPVLVILYFLALAFKEYKFRREISVIPGPPGHWPIGNLLWLLQHGPDEFFGFLRDCADKYWPIYKVTSPFFTTINLIHPQDIEIVLSETKHLNKSRVYSFLQKWLGEGLLTSGGSKWHTRRKILTPAFHFNILQNFLKIFNTETAYLVEQLEKVADQPHIDIIPYITQMTLQSIGETAMGFVNADKVRQIEYKESIYKMGKLLFTKIAKPWIRLPFIYPFTKTAREEEIVVKVLHKFSYDIIKQREQQMLDEKFQSENLESQTYSGKKLFRMLDLLLTAKIKDSNIDLEGIREEVDTFMFEGHDTTSGAISFLLLLLANHPDIQAKVSEEITSAIGDKNDPSSFDLQELQYTEMVIKESLRLYPSVPLISRYASEHFVTFTGYNIPKGAVLHMHIFDLHRNPEVYPDPLKFDPERFSRENTKARHPFAYLPFSAGPRNCIGQKFAMLEIKSVLCGVLRKFELRKVDSPEDVKFIPDIVLRTRNGIRIQFVKKN